MGRGEGLPPKGVSLPPCAPSLYRGKGRRGWRPRGGVEAPAPGGPHPMRPPKNPNPRRMAQGEGWRLLHGPLLAHVGVQPQINQINHLLNIII